MELYFIINGEEFLEPCNGQEIMRNVVKRIMHRGNGEKMDDHYIIFDDRQYRGERPIIDYVKGKEDRVVFVWPKKGVVKMPTLES